MRTLALAYLPAHELALASTRGGTSAHTTQSHCTRTAMSESQGSDATDHPRTRTTSASSGSRRSNSRDVDRHGSSIILCLRSRDRCSFPLLPLFLPPLLLLPLHLPQLCHELRDYCGGNGLCASACLVGATRSAGMARAYWCGLRHRMSLSSCHTCLSLLPCCDAGTRREIGSSRQPSYPT